MNLALFDFDGTITTREMLPDFFRFAVPKKRLAIGKIIFAPLVIGYKLGLVSGRVIRAGLVQFGFRDTSELDYQRHGIAFAAELTQVIRPQALEKIAWHKARGDTVVVVSGAFDVYLSHWCQQHSLDLICSSLEAHNGRLTGRYAGAQCVRKEKSRRINERFDLSTYPVIYAYGDTKEDLDMLALAHEKFYRWQAVV